MPERSLVRPVRQGRGARMKLFTVGDGAAAGGYVIGDGQLPPDFDPDAFMAKLGRKVMGRCMAGDPAALAEFEAQMSAALKGVPEVEQRSVHEISGWLDEE